MAYPYTYGVNHFCGQYPIPEVYDEALSYQQQIAHINAIICRLDNERLTECDLEAIRDELKRRINSLHDEMIKIIAETKKGALDWDVTMGKYDISPTVMTRIFNDLAVHAITIDNLATMEMTVDQLANCGLNCYGLAVWSGEAFTVSGNWEPIGVDYQGTDVRKKLTAKILAHAQVQDGFFVEGA